MVDFKVGRGVRGVGRRAAVVSLLALVGSLGSACTAEPGPVVDGFGTASGAAVNWPSAGSGVGTQCGPWDGAGPMRMRSSRATSGRRAAPTPGAQG
jgi:hypothetical protein